MPSVSNVEVDLVETISALKRYATTEPQALTPTTLGQLASFDAANPRSDPTLFFAANQSWNYYISIGKDEAVELCKRAAALSFIRSKDPIHQRNAIYLWLAALCASLIPITDLTLLLTDLNETLQEAGIVVDPSRVTTIILQAHVGVLQAGQTNGDSSSAIDLLQRNQTKLTSLHEDYRRRTDKQPDNRTADERNAWAYLLAAFPVSDVNRRENIVTGLLQQGDLAAAIQEGNHGGVFAYVSQNYDLIKRQLQARLEITFSPQDAIFPEFVVYVPSAQQRGQVQPMFTRAVDLLKRGEYETADALFERMAREVEGKGREICRNFRGYTRGKQGELAEARRLLRDLPDSQFNGASAYWNYACFTPNDQPQLQLKALEAGVRNAPQPLLLKGLIYLALLLDDQALLRSQLLLTTISEAILISFYLTYDEMSVEQRELAIGRLNVYRRQGEPAVPDPLSETLPVASINRFMDEMLEREQAPAFEYWLSSRSPKVTRTLNHLAINSDYLFQTNQIGRSLMAFRDELKTRLSRLERKNEERWFFSETTQRAARWLAASMNPEHREVGSDLYHMLATFDERVPRPRFRITPDVKKIRDYFAPLRKEMPPVATPDGRTTPTPFLGASELRPLPLEIALASNSQELFRDLRDVRSVPKVRVALGKIANALKAHGKVNAARDFLLLTTAWDKSLICIDINDRDRTWKEAGKALVSFESSVKSELEGPALDAIHLCIQAFTNVNRSVARFLDVLPSVIVKPLQGANVLIKSAAEHTSFPILVATNKSTPVKLTQLKADMHGSDLEVAVLDDFTAGIIMCSSEHPAILTLGVTNPRRLSSGGSVTVDLSYEFEAEMVRVSGLSVELRTEDGELSPKRLSPFVYGRKIEQFEIPDHFFGREHEQKQLLMGIEDSRRPRLNYVEGIRRSGKSSLLESIQFIIDRDQLPIVTIWVSFASSGLMQNAGSLIYELLKIVCTKLDMMEYLPSRERCISDPSPSLRDTLGLVNQRLVPKRLVIILDDLQTIEDMLNAYRGTDQPTFLGFVGFLNYIWEDARPNSAVGWILSGHRRLRDIHAASPEVLLWDALRPLPVGFFDLKTVDDVLRRSLQAVEFSIPEQSVARVHELTAGYPEIVQMVGERMFERATLEHRTILTPYDALEASTWVAHDHSFDTTWYPRAQLTDRQVSLLTAFINSVPLGGEIEAYKLLRQRALTPDVEQAILDLVARQILVKTANGVIRIKAHTLEVWLRNELASKDLGRMNGAVAVFIDLANLTHGTGSAVIRNENGGAVQVSTVLERIEDFAATEGAVKRGPRWVVNFPPGAPVECPA